MSAVPRAVPSPEARTAPPPVLTLTRIDKAYGTVNVLRGVGLRLEPGSVHALLGENGAGKSTLMKIIFGIVQPSAGEIVLDGERVKITGPRDALARGIGLVSQELSLVPQLDVASNIFLGHGGPLALVPRGSRREQARALLADLAPHIDVDALVGSLGMADRQLVEISRTLARGGRIVAFDEPTSSLTPAERDNLFAVIERLKADGKAIIYISHRMAEIRAICDTVTVLRDGKVIGSGPLARFDDDELNELIAGRRLSDEFANRPPPRDLAAAPVRLRMEGVHSARVRGVDLTVRQGEIFGLAGLVGSGRSAVMRTLFGVDPLTAGTISLEGTACAIRSPAEAIGHGIALIPEDRRGHAIVPMMSIEQNFALASLRDHARFGWIRGGRRRAAITRHIAEMHVRPPVPATPLANLSGGNQQKVIIARWLATGARVFLFDEPTRGVDVGAKAEIYALMRALAAEGAALVVVSSELPELMMLCDTIGIMANGTLAATLPNDGSLTEHRLMKYAAGEARS